MYNLEIPVPKNLLDFGEEFLKLLMYFHIGEAQLEFPSPRYALCQIWVKLALLVHLEKIAERF